MEFLSDLWMPILVSAVFVWIASFLMHMVLPFHKGDWKGLPDENRVAEALSGIPAGNYMLPHGTMADMKDPAFQERQRRGPNGTITIWDGMVNMGKNLVLTLLSYILIGVFVAYVCWHAFAGDTPEYLDVFRIAGTVAFMAHGLAYIPHVIWYRHVRLWPELLDAAIYGMVTAGTFGWLWPAVSTAA
ncbi:MAG: hypothetical protein M3R13_04110 [Armatimonadota bacterium]|nr:hypothetical protein [Armatimonadota bacterium]